MVIVTGRNSSVAASELARGIADLAWTNRERFVCEPTTMDEAVDSAATIGAGTTTPLMQ